MISDLFAAIDGKDVKNFLTFLSSDCVFRFGNLPAVKGREEIRNFVTGFFDSIDSLSHEIEQSWDTPDGLVCHGRVSYTRKDGSVLTVPFANIFKLDNSGIAEYLVFADTSQLYQ
ncbi:MAG: nuclear transport factor 2 family protein [Thiotrichales bacterium]|nr:MAG: nuclear transport factor 2 family protein [Thiotrichales bacterium]